MRLASSTPVKSSSLMRSTSMSAVMPALDDEHLDRAELLLDRGERGVDLVGVGDVARHAEQPVVGRAAAAAVGDGHPVARRRRTPGRVARPMPSAPPVTSTTRLVGVGSLTACHRPSKTALAQRHAGAEADEQHEVAVVPPGRARCASTSASGIDADEVLPVRSRTLAACAPSGMPSRWQAPR